MIVPPPVEIYERLWAWDLGDGGPALTTVERVERRDNRFSMRLLRTLVGTDPVPATPDEKPRVWGPLWREATSSRPSVEERIGALCDELEHGDQAGRVPASVAMPDGTVLRGEATLKADPHIHIERLVLKGRGVSMPDGEVRADLAFLLIRRAPELAKETRGEDSNAPVRVYPSRLRRP